MICILRPKLVRPGGLGRNIYITQNPLREDMMICKNKKLKSI
jgi:hypothetical protein